MNRARLTHVRGFACEEEAILHGLGEDSAGVGNHTDGWEIVDTVMKVKRYFVDLLNNMGQMVDTFLKHRTLNEAIFAYKRQQ